MIEPATRASEAKTLEQQKTDFTAEGAPAPGKVSAALPRKAVKVSRVRSNGPVTMPMGHSHPKWEETRPVGRA